MVTAEGGAQLAADATGLRQHYSERMTLSNDERELLRLVDESTAPVAMSDLFHTIHPPAPGLDEHHPDHEAWAELQLGLYGASINLHANGFVRIVSPANGERPDLVESTDAGRAALAV